MLIEAFRIFLYKSSSVNSLILGIIVILSFSIGITIAVLLLRHRDYVTFHVRSLKEWLGLADQVSFSNRIVSPYTKGYILFVHKYRLTMQLTIVMCAERKIVVDTRLSQVENHGRDYLWTNNLTSP